MLGKAQKMLWGFIALLVVFQGVGYVPAQTQVQVEPQGQHRIQQQLCELWSDSAKQ